MQFSSRAACLASLISIFATSINADCTQVSGNPGNLPMGCTTNAAPTQQGQTVLSNGDALSVTLQSVPNQGKWVYAISNRQNYDINWGMQFYNPQQGSNAWAIYTIKQGSDCTITANGHMEMFKLTC